MKKITFKSSTWYFRNIYCLYSLHVVLLLDLILILQYPINIERTRVLFCEFNFKYTWKECFMLSVLLAPIWNLAYSIMSNIFQNFNSNILETNFSKNNLIVCMIIDFFFNMTHFSRHECINFYDRKHYYYLFLKSCRMRYIPDYRS